MESTTLIHLPYLMSGYLDFQPAFLSNSWIARFPGLSVEWNHCFFTFLGVDGNCSENYPALYLHALYVFGENF